MWEANRALRSSAQRVEYARERTYGSAPFAGNSAALFSRPHAGLLGRRRGYDFLTASVDRTNANTVRVNCWRKRGA